MGRQQTYENLCVLLEEYADADIETVVEQILGLIGLDGEELLERLNPPPGLQHWLTSHGLALVAIAETRSPRVWEAAQQDATKHDDEDTDLEEESTPEVPLQVGDHAEYRTAPRGPRQESQTGAGVVIAVGDDGEPGSGEVAYCIRPVGRPDVFLYPSEGDIVRRA